jgi:hypothetical protein
VVGVFAQGLDHPRWLYTNHHRTKDIIASPGGKRM